MSVSLFDPDGSRVYLRPWPDAVHLGLAPGTTELPLPLDALPETDDLTLFGNRQLLVVVAHEGVFVLRVGDGELVDARRSDEGRIRLGFDDAQGELEVRGARCAIENARRGRFVAACRDRIVVLHAASRLLVLDYVTGRVLEEREVRFDDATSVGLSPSLDTRIGDVLVRVRGRIYVR